MEKIVIELTKEELEILLDAYNHDFNSEEEKELYKKLEKLFTK